MKVLQMDGITQEDIIRSLTILENRDAVFKAGESAGTSGSFFFFSHDNRFLLKTILREESLKLQQMLDDYIDHISDTGNKSLLARIYGIF